MPDFGFWSWAAIDDLGPFDAVATMIMDQEKALGFRDKKPKLVWRGSDWAAPEIRSALVEAAKDQPWGDVEMLRRKTWWKKSNFISALDQCKYMFIAHAEGR